MTTLAEALTTQTEAQILQGLLADLEAEGVDLAGFGPFALGTAMPVLQGRALAAYQKIRAAVTAAGFLDLAATFGDDWVDKIVRAWWLESRIPATQAKHLFDVTLAGSATQQTIDANSVVAEAAGGVLFDNGVGFRILPGQTRRVEFVARKVGIIGNILPGAVTGFQKGRPGLTVQNIAGSLIVVARDKEPNADLIARGRAKFAAKSVGGARDAYLVWVHEAFKVRGQVSTITKIGVDDENPKGPGSTDIYLANGAGPALDSEIAIVDAYLQPRRGQGTGKLSVLPAPTLNVPISVVLYTAGSSTEAIVGATVALAALVSAFPLGGTLFVDAIRKACLAVPGVFKVDVLAPTDDVPLSSYQLLTSTLSVSVKT